MNIKLTEQEVANLYGWLKSQSADDRLKLFSTNPELHRTYEVLRHGQELAKETKLLNVLTTAVESLEEFDFDFGMIGDEASSKLRDFQEATAQRVAYLRKQLKYLEASD